MGDEVMACGVLTCYSDEQMRWIAAAPDRDSRGQRS